MHTYTPADSISDGPVTNLLSVPCILIEILSRVHTKEGKSLNDLKFGTFIGCFLSEGAASMAVKGLISRQKTSHRHNNKDLSAMPGESCA